MANINLPCSAEVWTVTEKNEDKTMANVNLPCSAELWTVTEENKDKTMVNVPLPCSDVWTWTEKQDYRNRRVEISHRQTW